MKDTALTRRILKSVIDTLNDHHQEVTLAAAALNATLLEAEANGHLTYANIAARNFDKLAFLLGAHTARCQRTEAEVRYLQKRFDKP